MPIISVKNLSFGYEKNSIIQNISFDIMKGDFVAIIGPNGAGKTTLVKLLMGLLHYNKGEIKILGEPAKHLKDKSVIGYVPQRYSIDRLFPGTVKEILSSQNPILSKIPKELGVEKLFSKKFVDLSGGQQQRVLIALAMQKSPKILILDEPTGGIDAKTEKEFYEMLKHLNVFHKVTILLITHDIGMVPSVANRVMCINHNVFSLGKPGDEALLSCVYDSHEAHHHD